MYLSLQLWLAMVIGGMAGCVGVWAVLAAMAKVPFRAVGGNPGKQLWSVLFMIPVPAILWFVPWPLSWAVALAWLAVAPTVATKYYFGPRTVKFGKTVAFNAIYGLVALVVFRLVLSIG